RRWCMRAMVLLQRTSFCDPVVVRLSFLAVSLLSFSPRWQRGLPAPSQSVEGVSRGRLSPASVAHDPSARSCTPCAFPPSDSCVRRLRMRPSRNGRALRDVPETIGSWGAMILTRGRHFPSKNLQFCCNGSSNSHFGDQLVSTCDSS